MSATYNEQQEKSKERFVSHVALALSDPRLTLEDYELLQELIKKEKDRAMIERLDDNKVYIIKSKYGVKVDIPIVLQSYCKTSHQMMETARWNIDEDGYFIPEYLGKLGISVQSSVPEGGCFCEEDMKDPGGWSFGDWDDPAITSDSLPGYKIVTKTHLSAAKDKRFDTGVYYCPERESIYFVLERDGVATFYYGDDDETCKEPCFSVGKVVFYVGTYWKRKKADAKYLESYVKIMDYDPNILPSSFKTSEAD